jgi:hypothetical protein
VTSRPNEPKCPCFDNKNSSVKVLQLVLEVRIKGKGPENKVVRTLEKFSKGFDFPYSIHTNKGQFKLEFCVRNLAARTEILRRLRHVKGFELLSVDTQRLKGS